VIKIPTDKIREVIGSGGKVIREIVEKTGAKIDIEDDGTIKVASSDGKAIEAAIVDPRHRLRAGSRPDLRGQGREDRRFRRLRELLRRRRTASSTSPSSPQRVSNKTTDVVKEGDKVKVKLLGFDERGKVRLSMKVVDQATGKDITEEAFDGEAYDKALPERVRATLY
jgi:polyribonucleotide nucleotidyltransferase